MVSLRPPAFPNVVRHTSDNKTLKTTLAYATKSREMQPHYVELITHNIARKLCRDQLDEPAGVVVDKNILRALRRNEL